MIKYLSDTLAVSIKAAVPNHPSSVEVLRYSLGIVLNFVFIVTFSLLISLFLGISKEVLIVMASIAVLRQISGGIHLKSGLACVIVSTTLILLTAYFSEFLSSNAILILNLINMVITARFAPSKIDKQTRIPKKFFPLLTVLAILLVYSNIIFESQIIAAAFFVQCVTLIHFQKKGGNEYEKQKQFQIP